MGMKHRGTQTITTDRLILRRFGPEDAGPMYANWCNDPDVTAFLMWLPHTDLEVTRKVLADWVRGYEQDNYYQWAIVPKDLEEPIGTISIVQQRDDTAMVHVGYCIGKRWWHCGYTSEALAAVIAFLFGEVGVNRIEARHDPRNPNSGKVMEKCGMQYEGTLRQADINQKGLCDASYYGILREDWGKGLA